MSTTRQKPLPDNYNNADHGQSERLNFGMHILKPGVKGIVKKPSWNGTTTVFRPFPCLSYEEPDTAFEPFRVDPGGRNFFGRWIRRYGCAWSVGAGANKITFIISDPAERAAGFDPYNTPLGVLYRAIEQACKKGHSKTPEWQPLREGGAGKGKPLTPPSEMYLMQGVILVIDSKKQYGGGKVPIGWGKETCFFCLSKGAGQTFIDKMNEAVPNFHGDPGDFEKRYLNGDVCSPQNGRFLFIYQKGHDPRLKFGSQPTQGGEQQSWADSAPTEHVGGESGKGGFEDKGYDMHMEKTLEGMSAKMDKPNQLDMIRQKWCYWKESIYVPTQQEQAQMLWSVFPKSACIYAWEGFNSAWISPEMWKEYKGAVSVAMGGNSPPAASADTGGAFGPSESFPFEGGAEDPASAGSDLFPDGPATEDAVLPAEGLAPGAGTAVNAVLPAAETDPFATGVNPGNAAAFDAPAPAQAGGTPQTAQSLGKLAAARAAARAKSQGQPAQPAAK